MVEKRVAYDYENRRWVEGEEAVRVELRGARTDLAAASRDLMPEHWYDGEPRTVVIGALKNRVKRLESELADIVGQYRKLQIFKTKGDNDMESSKQNKPTLSRASEGCWVDCSRGIFIGERAQQIAEAHGWSGYTQEGEEVVLVNQEEYHEAWDAAEEFLNELAPEGYWVGSNENGDFGMWEYDEE